MLNKNQCGVSSLRITKKARKEGDEMKRRQENIRDLEAYIDVQIFWSSFFLWCMTGEGSVIVERIDLLMGICTGW